jgi:energy-coupling factor transport system substrate-specific component
MAEQAGKKRWLSTMDLLIMAAVGVVGAVFSSRVWPLVMNVATPMFAFLGPVGWIAVSGIYVIWPVIVGCLVAKAGAVTIYAVIQGFVEMLFGNTFGVMAMVYSGLEGLGVDLGLGISKWKPTLPTVMIGAGLGSLFVDEAYIFLFKMNSLQTVILGGITAFISGAVLGGLVGWLIAQALYKTGVVSKIGLKGYEEID